MGNFNSCIYTTLQTATLLDPNGKIHQIQLPITAAELMFDHPGLVISPADLIRFNSQISAIKADDQLSPGKLYLLVSPTRVHSKATSSDMELIDSVSKKKGYNRCSSKVSPVAVTDIGSGNMTCHRQSGQWKPVLEPIFEEPCGNTKRSTR